MNQSLKQNQNIKEGDYIKLVAFMLYTHKVHEILAGKKPVKNLINLRRTKRFKGIYPIFSGCSFTRNVEKILKNVHQQLGIYSGEDLGFLLSYNKQQLIDWFSERHQKNKVLQCGIYKIYCRKTQQFYFVRTFFMKRRIKGHQLTLRAKNDENFKLQDAWDLHGEDSFDFMPLEYTTEINSRYWALLDESCENNHLSMNIGLGIDFTIEKWVVWYRELFKRWREMQNRRNILEMNNSETKNINNHH